MARGRRPTRAGRLPAATRKGYALLRPGGEAFWRQATCEEVRCVGYLNGFELHVDEGTELGQRQAAYLRADRTRRGRERREGALTVFAFQPGQRCTSATDDNHRVAIEREPLYVVRTGDWRRTGDVRTHTRPELWVEDFATHQDKIAAFQARG